MVVLDERPSVRSRLDRLSAASVTSRLHLAVVLVGRLKMDSRTVLDLRWSGVDLVRNELHGTVVLPRPVPELFYWHAVRQRLDFILSRRWADPGFVFVNRYGSRFTVDQANVVVADCCKQAGLPAVPLAGLRHPVWAS
ncbi:MAG: hypothetical protein V9G10_03655 [Candidatus Nanopelagicales bacterium]